MGTPVIYADITLLINVGLDFFLLWLTSKMTMRQVSFWRLMSGALLGGLYSLGYVFFPRAFIFHFIGKLIFSLFMLYVVFRPRDLHSIKSLILIFYVCSLLLAGLCLGLYYSEDSGKIVAPWLLLIPALLMLGLLGRGIIKQWASLSSRMAELKVKITFLGNQVVGKGFLDTGNGLIDPFSKRPVVVIEAALWYQLLPEPVVDWHDALSAGAQLSSQEELAERIRMIPYSSVGKKQGILLGFRCDEIVISTQTGSKSSWQGVIAVAPESLAMNGEYQCLVPTGFFTDV